MYTLMHIMLTLSPDFFWRYIQWDLFLWFNHGRLITKMMINIAKLGVQNSMLFWTEYGKVKIGQKTTMIKSKKLLSFEQFLSEKAAI